MIDTSIIGKRFGRLVVIEFDRQNKYGSTWWLCRCDCGNTKSVYRGCLTSGDVRSCGCYRNEHRHEYGLKHGLSNSKLYAVWAEMIQRCTNPNAHNYYRYGGRGIEVCKEWLHSFDSFYSWAIDNGYQDGLSIDRINNQDGYHPLNCRWVDRITQANNTRINHLVTYNNMTKTIAEWSRILGVNHETLRYRVNHERYDDFERYFKQYEANNN